MKKVLSLVLSLVLVLGMMPVFAVEDMGSAGENLKHYEFITGGTGGDLMEDKEFTREQLAKILAELNGKAEEAAAFEGTVNFKDADEIGAWALPYVAYAVEQDWLVGNDKNEFMPKGIVSGKELLTAMLRVLGYETEWATVVEEAAEVGFTASEGELTRGQAFETLWTVVSEIPAKGSDVALGVELGKLEPETPVVTDLEVKNVVSNNLKVLAVEFNQAVDKKTVKDSTVKVYEGSASAVSSTEVSEDGMTVFVELKNITQSDSVKMTIEGVKTAEGKEVVKYEEEFILNDVTVPALESAVALNPKQVELTFTEPVQLSSPELFTLMNDVKIDNTSVIAKAAPNNFKNTVILTLSTALAEGTHTIEVKGVKDYAQFVAPTMTLDFTVVKDEAAPVATSLTVKSKDEVVVTFDEPVNVTGSFKIDPNLAAYTPANGDWNAQRTSVTLKNANLGIAAIVEVKVQYKGQKDIMGNEVKEWASIVTNVEDDSTLPTVELTSVGEKNKLTFTFSKPMASAGEIQLLNKDGKLVTKLVVNNDNLFKADTNHTVIEYTPAELNKIDPADYSAKLVDMKDRTVRANPLATTTLAFKAIDTKAPSIADKYVVTPNTSTPVNNDKDTITVFFTEAMNVETIQNLGNYQIAGKPLSADSKAVSAKAASDAKSVVITYKEASLVDPGMITVYAVKDVAGNMIGTVGNTASKGNTADLTVTGSAQATAVNKIRVTFDTAIKNVAPSVFGVFEGNSAVTNFVDAKVLSDGKTVEFTTGSDIKPNAEIYTIKTVGPTSITNIYGKNLAATQADVGVVDKIRPELKKVEQYKANDVVINNKIAFTFTEPVQGNFVNQLIVKSSAGVILGTGANNAGDFHVVMEENDTRVVLEITGSTLVAIQDSEAGEKTIKVGYPLPGNVTDKATPANGILSIADQEVTIKVDATNAAAEVAATNAVVAYEQASLETIAGVTTAEGLKLDAETKVTNLNDGTVKTDLTQRISNRAAVITAERAKIQTLTDAVAAAQTQHDNAIEGNNSGEYPAPAKADYQTAITSANSVATTGTSTIIEVEQATTDLGNAKTTFEGLVTP
ncbi:S-layer homology domain-containing protein [Fusibacter sp. JL298sf-3]